MRADILITLASVVSAGLLDPRRQRDCTATETETETETETVTYTPRPVTKTVTVTAAGTSGTSSIGSSSPTSTTKPGNLTTSTTTNNFSPFTTTTTSSKTASATVKVTTVPTTSSIPTTTKTTTTQTTTKPATTTATNYKQISAAGIHQTPNGQKWHVQCDTSITGSNSIIGYSDSTDNLAQCLDYCSTVSGAGVAQYTEDGCECWQHGGTGVASSPGTAFAYHYDDNS